MSASEKIDRLRWDHLLMFRRHVKLCLRDYIV